MTFVQQQVVSEGHSVLLFCSSRKGCETSARHIAKFLPPFSILERKNASGPVDGNAAVEELRRCPAGLDAVLADTLPAGVAYHHAGLTVRLSCEPLPSLSLIYAQGGYVMIG